MVIKNTSKFVLILWLCLAFILMQSYTANLSSMLTLDQLQPTFDSVKDLQEKGYFVGYKRNSFVEDLLLELKFDESKLIPYDTIHQYHEALSKGSESGGVAAIFDGIPYIKVFLAKYSSQYMMAGPIYRTDGFAFAFPKNSPLVSYISKAVLEVREGDTMDKIQKRYFGDKKITCSYLAPISTESSSLRTYNFGGLFIIAGIATLLALFTSQIYIWRKPVALVKKYSRRFLSSNSRNGTETELVTQSTNETDAGGHSGESERNSRRSSEYFSAEEDETNNREPYS